MFAVNIVIIGQFETVDTNHHIMVVLCVGHSVPHQGGDWPYDFYQLITRELKDEAQNYIEMLLWPQAWPGREAGGQTGPQPVTVTSPLLSSPLLSSAQPAE